MNKIKRRKNVKECKKLDDIIGRVAVLEATVIQLKNKIEETGIQPILQVVETSPNVIPEKSQNRKETLAEIDELLEKKRLSNKNFERREK